MKNITKIIMLCSILAGTQTTTTHCMELQPNNMYKAKPIEGIQTPHKLTTSITTNKKFIFTTTGLIIIATGCALYAITKKSYWYGLIATGLCATTIGLKFFSPKKKGTPSTIEIVPAPTARVEYASKQAHTIIPTTTRYEDCTPEEKLKILNMMME